MNPRVKASKGIIVSEQCPKCDSCMFMLRHDQDGYFHKCRDCGHRKYERPVKRLAAKLRRLLSWKSIRTLSANPPTER